MSTACSTLAGTAAADDEDDDEEVGLTIETPPPLSHRSCIPESVVVVIDAEVGGLGRGFPLANDMVLREDCFAAKRTGGGGKKGGELRLERDGKAGWRAIWVVILGTKREGTSLSMYPSS